MFQTMSNPKNIPVVLIRDCNNFFLQKKEGRENGRKGERNGGKEKKKGRKTKSSKKVYIYWWHIIEYLTYESIPPNEYILASLSPLGRLLVHLLTDHISTNPGNDQEGGNVLCYHRDERFSSHFETLDSIWKQVNFFKPAILGHF